MALLRTIHWLLLCSLMLVGQTDRLVADDARLQVLNFSMERCEPCRSMQPVLAKLIMEGWQIRDIDIAKEPQLTAQFKLQSAPTIVMLSGGREVDRVVGAIAYNKLLARLQAASRAATAGTSGSAASQLASTPTAASPRASTTSSASSANSNGPTAPQLLAKRNAQNANSPSFEPSLVRGQSPGPADVPDLDIDSQRMLDFVKDLPEPPSFPPTVNNSQPAQPAFSHSTPATLASASSSVTRASGDALSNPVQPAYQATPVAPQFDPQVRAQQATVRIRIEDANSIAFGTGTVIYVHNGQALVLTCGHLFRDIGRDARMSVDVFDKAGQITNVPAGVVSHSTEDGDIGLMEFRCPYPITPVPIAKQAPNVGERAFSFGCDRGADPSLRATQVKHINRYLGPANVEIMGAPVVGRSGGGLFNSYGQLIGVCNAADAEDDEGIYAALPVIEKHVAALRLESMPTDDLAATVSANPVQLASTTQVRCVIRDAQGKETALLIERPSEQLMEMLREASRR